MWTEEIHIEKALPVAVLKKEGGDSFRGTQGSQKSRTMRSLYIITFVGFRSEIRCKGKIFL